MLYLSYGNVDAVPVDPRGLELSEYRLEGLSALLPEEKRRQSIGAELLLMRALADQGEELRLPLQIEADEKGKPRLLNSHIQFNLSHSGPYAACVLSDVPVGLDLQVKSPCKDALLRRCFCRAEQEYIDSSPDRDEAFSEIWTQKESYLKALGLGLRKPMNSFSVFDLPDGVSVWHTVLDGLHFSVCTLSGPAVPDAVNRRNLP